MRITQLRQADLNLLVVFTVLAEERNVSRAAERLLLSQPAVTRALQRLREMFHDELLVRVTGNYELTPKGQSLLKEVETMLPRLDRLLAGSTFDPSTEAARFRLSGSDYASYVVGIPLAKHFMESGNGLSFDFSPLSDEVFEAMDRGRIDLLLYADDGNVPAHLSRTTIFEEEFVCVVSKDSPYAHKITLNQYLEAVHIGIAILGGSQTIPDQRLASSGLKRNYAFRVPYFEVAIRTVPGTKLIATVPKRIAISEGQNSGWRVVKAPKPMERFRYLMAWHSRMESDAAHLWLRSVVHKIGKTI
jgi:DNA-binding transcriptional LysR family regulator